MKEKTPTTVELMEQGVRYEILCEILSEEIGHHNELVRQFGKDTKSGQVHLSAIAELVRVKDLLDPDNAAQLEAVLRMLLTANADRSTLSENHVA